MNELKFTVYKAWLDAVTERGLTPSRVQGHNNFECVVDGVLVAFWNGHESTGTAVEIEPPVVTEDQVNADG